MKTSTRTLAGAVGLLAAAPTAVVIDGSPAGADAGGCDRPTGIHTCLSAVEGGHYFNLLYQKVHFDSRYDGCLTWLINFDYVGHTATETYRECFHGSGDFTHTWRKNWQAPDSLFRVCATMRRDDGALQTGYACLWIG